MTKPQGWPNESARHALASKGIKTSPDGKILNPSKGHRFKKEPMIPEDQNFEFWLDTEAQIYVPSTTDVGEPISDEEFRERIRNVQDEFTQKFEGTTTFLGEGTYISDDNEFIEEDVAIVEVHMTEEDWEDNKRKILRWLEDKQDEWEQESISFELEGNLTFIE